MWSRKSTAVISVFVVLVVLAGVAVPVLRSSRRQNPGDSGVAAGKHPRLQDESEATSGLNLTATPPPPVITRPGAVFEVNLGAAVEAGRPFSYQIHASNQPDLYAATNLPAGLILDQATGHITGAVAVQGTYVIGLSASNAGGTGTATLTLVVDDGGYEVEATQ